MATDVEWAWTAGIIDGDGCISITRALNGTRSWKPAVLVDSTDREILEELLRLHGGGKLVAKRNRAEHHRQAWSWRLYGADNVLAFLAAVLPYLRCPTKRDRAQLIVDEYKALTPRNGRYTPEQWEAKAALGERVLAIGHGRGSRGMRRADDVVA